MSFSREDLLDMQVEKEINNYKHVALTSLKTIVDPRFADKLLPLISYCMQEEFPEAIEIFGHLKLEEKHAVASLDNRDLFKVLLIEECNEQILDYEYGEYAYEGTYA